MRAPMTLKSCAVRMGNAILRNYLKRFGACFASDTEFSKLLNQYIMSFSAAAPKLHEVTPDMLDSLTSRSTPVIARAQQCPNEEMRRLKLPWWKKLWDENAVDGPGVRFSKDPKTSRARRLFGALFG